MLILRFTLFNDVKKNKNCPIQSACWHYCSFLNVYLFHLLLASVSICLVIKQLQQTILNTYHQMISHVIIYVIINIVESIPFTQSMSMKFTQDVEPWEVKGSLLATRCSHHQPPRPMTREASSNHWPLTINVKRPMNERLRRIRMTLYIINIYKYR